MNSALVFQTDFGLKDGAVSAMYGVAFSVNPELRIFDLTHDIPPYNIWEASYRLIQTISYWRSILCSFPLSIQASAQIEKVS